MLKINNVKVSLNEKDYRKSISTKLNVPQRMIKEIKILKKSIDARRAHVAFICSFAFSVDKEEELLERFPKELTIYKPYEYVYPKKNEKKVVIVGSGPAGLFCAYVLSHIHQKVVLVERGAPVEQRIKDVDELVKTGTLNPNSNIAFGEGGAGTFSDGKLTTGIKNPRIPFILQTFIDHGAPEDIGYLSMPHIGTDRLRSVIRSMRKDIIAHGGEVMFNTKFEDFKETKSGHEVIVSKEGKKISLETDALVLAIGHSARDTYEMLCEKHMEMEAKSFAIGVRIEQSQKKINAIQYGKQANHPALGAAPYKLAVQTSKKRGVYTFCMCPGGYIVPSSTIEGELCVNGMSYYDRLGENANSAILVTVDKKDYPEDHPLSGIAFQRALEKKAFEAGGGAMKAAVQRVVDYLNNKPSTDLGDIKPTYKPGYTLTNINEIFPDFINENLHEGLQLMNHRMKGFYDEQSIITGIEGRSSAPVRLIRNQDMVSSIGWIYPIGEGAGYAGGIMSSAIDGILCAEKICEEEK